MELVKSLDKQPYYYLEKGRFLAYYFTSHSGVDDLVSKYLLDFKDGKEPITSLWIDLAGSIFSNHFQPDLIVRVLGSDEIKCHNNTPLDKLGKEISSKTGSIYNPSCLFKIRETKPLKYLNRDERRNEINGAYSFSTSNRNIGSILLIDDIITSGTTIKEIKRAITEEIGNFRLYLFVLGKTYDSWRDNNADNTDIQKLFESRLANRRVWLE